MPNRVEPGAVRRLRRPPTGGAGAVLGVPLRWGPHHAGKPASPATLGFLLSLLSPEPERRGEVQWMRAERLLAIHRLGPLAFASDRALGGGLLPRSVAGRLEPGYLAARESTLRYLDLSERIGETFRAEEIPCLRFGGVALTRGGIYGDPGARPVDGLELWVSSGSVERAARLLRVWGLEPESDDESPQRVTLGALRFSCRNGMDRDGMSLELTWSPSLGSTVSPDDAGDAPFWIGADGETGAPAPGPHLALLAERLVAGIGDRSYLRRLADIGRLVPRVESWERFLRVAEPRPYAAGVGLLLRILEEETGAPIPRGVIRTLGGSRIGLRPIASRIRPSSLLRRGSPGPGLSAEVLRRGTLLATPARALHAAIATLWPSEGRLRARSSEPRSPLGELRLRHLSALLSRAMSWKGWLREGKELLRGADHPVRGNGDAPPHRGEGRTAHPTIS